MGILTLGDGTKTIRDEISSKKLKALQKLMGCGAKLGVYEPYLP